MHRTFPGKASDSRKKGKPQDSTLGVRPEHISICEPEQAYIQATVDMAEMMGSSVHLHMTVQGREKIVVVPTHTAPICMCEYYRSGKVLNFVFTSEFHIFSERGNNY